MPDLQTVRAGLQTPGLYWQRQEDRENATEPFQQQAAFIGFTQTIFPANEDYTPQLIQSLKQFETIYGYARKQIFSLQYDHELQRITLQEKEGLPEPGFLHAVLTQFFANGGNSCYVSSIGEFPDPNMDQFQSTSVIKKCEEAITRLEQQQDINLLLIPEAVCLPVELHYQVMQTLLLHCQKMQNRFAIIDVHQSSQTQALVEKDSIGLRKHLIHSLDRGAAYYPFQHSTIAPLYDDDQVLVNYRTQVKRLHSKFQNKWRTLPGATRLEEARYIPIDSQNTLVDQAGYQVDQYGQRIEGMAPVAIYTDKSGLLPLDAQGYVMQAPGSGLRKKMHGRDYRVPIETELLASTEYTLENLADARTRLWNLSLAEEVRSFLQQQMWILPPSAAVAGVIQNNDQQNGVWVPPANIGLKALTGPVTNLDAGQQAGLNIDAIGGKSINVLRHFAGEGCKIWGARTLRGNDEQWRYINVRRLFIWLEQELLVKTQFAVFERSGPFTWLKIQVICEAVLQSLWQQGALYGAAESEAYEVQVGLGSTMTEEDINAGLIRVSIKLAALRPSEFIVFSFTHHSHSG